VLLVQSSSLNAPRRTAHDCWFGTNWGVSPAPSTRGLESGEFVPTQKTSWGHEALLHYLSIRHFPASPGDRWFLIAHGRLVRTLFAIQPSRPRRVRPTEFWRVF
jgi:hypothetical protein